MKPEIRAATLRDTCFVAANMRDEDRREALATLNVRSMTEIGVLCFLGSPDTAWNVWVDAAPVASFGYSMRGDMQPHLCSAWAWGTSSFKRAVPAITRFCLANWPSMMASAGLTRAEIRSLAGHDIAHSWLASLGARREGLMHGYGINGEDFELWALMTEDFN